MNSSVPQVAIVAHPDINIQEKNTSTDGENSSENGINNKSRDLNKNGTPSKDKDIVMIEDDDQESVVIEEIHNKAIEVDEDSNDEVEMVMERSPSAKETQNNNTKASEFVVVNAANISLIEAAGNDGEVVSRCPMEDIQIKDELAETVTADMSSNDILENDPMDLLEINNRSEGTSSTRSQEDIEDYCDDMSTSSAQTGSSSSLSLLNWIKEYPWLLYEESDENGYCLYCDVKINIRSRKTVKQHGLSLYHKERCENYLAFCEEEEKNGLSTGLVEVKQEFGTDSCVQALKLKRKSQNEAFNNFNWRRWLRDYSWLERDTMEGTVGYCKYCLMHLNVEFSYLRDRHQESGKHKDAERQYEGLSKKNKQSNLSDGKISETNTDDSQSNNERWLEIVDSGPNYAQMVQCKLCQTKMVKSNFLRHLRTNLHLNNEKIYKEKQSSSDQKDVDRNGQYNWRIYSKQHPWLISDPIDPKYAYCKYCEKRVIYGSSAAKRSTHENSSQHKLNSRQRMVDSKKKGQDKDSNEKSGEEEAENVAEQMNDDEYDVEEDDEEERKEDTSEGGKNEDSEDEDLSEKEAENDDDYNDNSEEESKNGESEDEIDSKKRVYRLTEEWLKQYTWCRRYNKDPKNFFFCIYCKIPLRASSSRPKHQKSAMHIAAEKEYLKRQEKKQKFSERNQTNGNDDSTFEWAIPLKGKINMYSCKYCRVRISKHYSKKNHAASKIHQINESIYKSNGRQKSSGQEDDNNKPIKTLKYSAQQTNIATSKKGQTFAKVIIKVPSTLTLIKQWQKKFPWLSYKRNELRSNYGHCKICDCSLYLRSFKHVLRHVRSGRHARLTKMKNKQKQEQDQGDDFSATVNSKGPKIELKTSPDRINDAASNKMNSSNAISAKINDSPKYFNYRSTIIELKKRFSWIESSDKPNYGYCRFCSTNIPLKILFLRNHSNSPKHRSCVKNYCGEGVKTPNETNDDEDINEKANVGEKNNEDDDDDVVIVEENNEEILISEQDENWTVKSETMDEHEELDFLLQRSFNSSLNRTNAKRNVRKSVAAEDQQPAPKRLKRSQSLKRLSDNNSLVASLLTAPLTLASCLGPLIQQQIQQVNNTQQLLANTSTPMTPTQKALYVESENTLDLFFKSVSETMKKLPIDIAAEGKVRIMQTICDLELQALKREQSIPTDIVSSNTSGVNYQPASTSSITQLACNNVINNSNNNDRLLTDQQPTTCNDTIITQIHGNAAVSPPVPSTTLPVNKSLTSTSSAVNQSIEKLSSATSTSPIIGLMDRNGIQKIQLKASLAKQVPRSTANTCVTTVANTGIRCIPFKNLSQTVAPSDQTNSKVTRIQVPLNVPSQSVTSNASPVTTQKSLINFRNIQISKRLSTTPTSTTSVNILNNVQQQKQASSQASPITNKSPQRGFITNIQPQLQRWGSTLNGTASHPSPTSSAINQQSQMSSSQPASTPVAKKH